VVTQVLLDTKFILGSLAVHVDLNEAFSHIFDTSPFSLWITECTKAELETQASNPALVAFLRRVKVVQCNHKLVQTVTCIDESAVKAASAPDTDSGSDSSDDSSDSESGPEGADNATATTALSVGFPRKLTSAKCIARFARTIPVS
jgi:hypothetical protein